MPPGSSSPSWSKTGSMSQFRLRMLQTSEGRGGGGGDRLFKCPGSAIWRVGQGELKLWALGVCSNLGPVSAVHSPSSSGSNPSATSAGGVGQGELKLWALGVCSNLRPVSAVHSSSSGSNPSATSASASSKVIVGAWAWTSRNGIAGTLRDCSRLDTSGDAYTSNRLSTERRLSPTYVESQWTWKYKQGPQHLEIGMPHTPGEYGCEKPNVHVDTIAPLPPAISGSWSRDMHSLYPSLHV